MSATPGPEGDGGVAGPVGPEAPSGVEGAAGLEAPAGMQGPAGPLLRIVKDQRLAFLVVGSLNTVIALAAFAALQYLVGRHIGRYGYMVTLVGAYVIAVLCAFYLYRHLVFEVRGHVLRDLARFASVYLTTLGVNAVLLPLLVELAGLAPLVAQVCVLVVTTLISWFGHKYFSFRRAPGQAH